MLAWLLPHIVWGILRLTLWRMNFRINVVGFFTYSDIMLNVPIHLNFNLLVRIKWLKIRLSAKSKPISIWIEGLDLGKNKLLTLFSTDSS